MTFNSATISVLSIFKLLSVSSVLLLLFSDSLCYADTNSLIGSSCGARAPINSNNAWRANLNNVFNSLAANVNQNGGYYTAEAVQDSDRMYGLIQCRGDISPSDCSVCTQESFRQASSACDGSAVSASIWQKWCFLRYSNTSTFYGSWERTGAALSHGTNDDPAVSANGMLMMEGLVDAASNDTLMSARSEMDDGRGGKRYGMAQCTRDLRMSDCRDCLNYLLTAYNTTIAGRRSWEAYAVGCEMWYDDYLFYFTSNSTASSPAPSVPNGSMVSPPPSSTAAPPPASSDSASRFQGVKFALGITILMIAMAYL